jgi:hypothetical protein
MSTGDENWRALVLRVEDAPTVDTKAQVPVTLTGAEIREAALSVLGSGGYGYGDAGDAEMDAHALAVIVLALLEVQPADPWRYARPLDER